MYIDRTFTRSCVKDEKKRIKFFSSVSFYLKQPNNMPRHLKLCTFKRIGVFVALSKQWGFLTEYVRETSVYKGGKLGTVGDYTRGGDLKTESRHSISILVYHTLENSNRRHPLSRFTETLSRLNTDSYEVRKHNNSP